jgi:hypothetical protein
MSAFRIEPLFSEMAVQFVLGGSNVVNSGRFKTVYIVYTY